MGAERNWHMANIWESVAQVIPESEAVVFEDQRLTWKSYENQAASIAQVFVDHHLKPDAKVSIYSYNSIEYLVAQFAALRHGYVPLMSITDTWKPSWLTLSIIATARLLFSKQPSRRA